MSEKKKSSFLSLATNLFKGVSKAAEGAAFVKTKYELLMDDTDGDEIPQVQNMADSLAVIWHRFFGDPKLTGDAKEKERTTLKVIKEECAVYGTEFKKLAKLISDHFVHVMAAKRTELIAQAKQQGGTEVA